MELHFPYCKVVMDKQLLSIYALTFIIHIIGTLAYSMRIATSARGASPCRGPCSASFYCCRALLPKPANVTGLSEKSGVSVS